MACLSISLKHRPQIRGGGGHELDVLADRALEELAHFADDGIHVEDLGMRNLAAREDEQLANERGGALGGAADLLNVPPERRPITCPASTRNESAISETATRCSPVRILSARATALTTPGRPPRPRGAP